MGKEGMRKKAIAKVPTMEPAVEMAARVPAVRPIDPTSRAARRVANGEMVPIRTLGRAKRRSAASSA